MLNSIMYKMCYYDFGGIVTEHQQPPGYDRVRYTEIGAWGWGACVTCEMLHCGCEVAVHVE